MYIYIYNGNLFYNNENLNKIQEKNQNNKLYLVGREIYINIKKKKKRNRNLYYDKILC